MEPADSAPGERYGVCFRDRTGEGGRICFCGGGRSACCQRRIACPGRRRQETSNTPVVIAVIVVLVIVIAAGDCRKEEKEIIRYAETNVGKRLLQFAAVVFLFLMEALMKP